MFKRQQRRVRGLAMLLDWLAAQPGQSWQERWLASGADRAGAGWRQLPAQWLRDRGLPGEGRQAELCSALTVVICADLIRPSLGWLVSADARGNGALVRGLPCGCGARVWAGQAAAAGGPRSLGEDQQDLARRRIPRHHPPDHHPRPKRSSQRPVSALATSPGSGSCWLKRWPGPSKPVT